MSLSTGRVSPTRQDAKPPALPVPESAGSYFNSEGPLQVVTCRAAETTSPSFEPQVSQNQLLANPQMSHDQQAAVAILAFMLGRKQTPPIFNDVVALKEVLSISDVDTNLENILTQLNGLDINNCDDRIRNITPKFKSYFDTFDSLSQLRIIYQLASQFSNPGLHSDYSATRRLAVQKIFPELLELLKSMNCTLNRLRNKNLVTHNGSDFTPEETEAWCRFFTDLLTNNVDYADQLTPIINQLSAIPTHNSKEILTSILPHVVGNAELHRRISEIINYCGTATSVNQQLINANNVQYIELQLAAMFCVCIMVSCKTPPQLDAAIDRQLLVVRQNVNPDMLESTHTLHNLYTQLRDSHLVAESRIKTIIPTFSTYFSGLSLREKLNIVYKAAILCNDHSIAPKENAFYRIVRALQASGCNFSLGSQVKDNFTSDEIDKLSAILSDILLLQGKYVNKWRIILPILAQLKESETGKYILGKLLTKTIYRGNNAGYMTVIQLLATESWVVFEVIARMLHLELPVVQSNYSTIVTQIMSLKFPDACKMVLEQLVGKSPWEQTKIMLSSLIPIDDPLYGDTYADTSIQMTDGMELNEETCNDRFLVLNCDLFSRITSFKQIRMHEDKIQIDANNTGMWRNLNNRPVSVEAQATMKRLIDGFDQYLEMVLREREYYKTLYNIVTTHRQNIQMRFDPRMPDRLQISTQQTPDGQPKWEDTQILASQCRTFTEQTSLTRFNNYIAQRNSRGSSLLQPDDTTIGSVGTGIGEVVPPVQFLVDEFVEYLNIQRTVIGNFYGFLTEVRAVRLSEIKTNPTIETKLMNVIKESVNNKVDEFYLTLRGSGDAYNMFVSMIYQTYMDSLPEPLKTLVRQGKVIVN